MIATSGPGGWRPAWWPAHCWNPSLGAATHLAFGKRDGDDGLRYHSGWDVGEGGWVIWEVRRLRGCRFSISCVRALRTTVSPRSCGNCTPQPSGVLTSILARLRAAAGAT